MKAAASADTPKILRPFFRWMGLAMIFLVLYTVWQNGFLARFLQNEDFREYLVAADQARLENSKTILFGIQTNPTDAFSRPWDGISIGGVIGPIFSGVDFRSPPDLVACIVAFGEPKAQCGMKANSFDVTSNCQNSFSCDWNMQVPISNTYAIVVFDADEGWNEGPWDFVDAILFEGRSPDQVDKVERAVRQLIKLASPTTIGLPETLFSSYELSFHKGEEQRRIRPLFVITEAAAIEGVPLPQSSFYLFSQ